MRRLGPLGAPTHFVGVKGMRRRTLLAWISFPIFAIAIFAAAVSASAPGSEELRPARSRPPSAPVLGEAAKCAPIINGLAAQSETDGFARAGLGNVDLPAFLATRYSFRSYTCLEDHLAQRVQGVVITLLEGDGSRHGALVVLPAGESGSSDWASYLQDVDPDIAEFVEIGGVLLGVHSPEAAAEIREGGSTRSLWSQLVEQLGAAR